MKKLIKLMSALLMLSMVFSCNSEDDQDIDPSTKITSQELKGSWKVSYFWDQIVETSDYNEFVFTFDSEGDLEVAVSGIMVGGSYDIWIDQNNSIIDFYFNSSTSSNLNDKLRELTENWIVTSVSANKNMIEFEERESENPPEILHFTRVQ